MRCRFVAPRREQTVCTAWALPCERSKDAGSSRLEVTRLCSAHRRAPGCAKPSSENGGCRPYRPATEVQIRSKPRKSHEGGGWRKGGAKPTARRSGVSVVGPTARSRRCGLSLGARIRPVGGAEASSGARCGVAPSSSAHPQERSASPCPANRRVCGAEPAHGSTTTLIDGSGPPARANASAAASSGTRCVMSARAISGRWARSMAALSKARPAAWCP